MCPEPLVKNKPRSRNKDGTWRKKRSDAHKILEFAIPTYEELEDKIKALERQVDVWMKDNGELRIKLKAYEMEAEVKKNE